MSTSPISFSPAAPAPESQAVARQGDGDSAGESFSQALTREISERSDASQASPSRPADPADQKAAGKTTKTEESRPTGEKGKEAEKNDAADAAAGSIGMLAFMIDAHQLSGKSAPADKAEASTDKQIGLDAGTTKKNLLLKTDATTAATGDKKIADTHERGKATPDTGDMQGSSKAKSFAENLREAGKDAHPVHGDTAKAATPAAEIHVEALQKNASEHDRASELHALAGSMANQMPLQQAAGLLAPQAMAASTLSPQVGTAAWYRALGQKIVWMVAGGQQSASLTLNPPDLGPLQVVLNVSNSMADATFITAQPEVRHALEQAMPKLREMMSQAGIQLGQANVNTGTPNGNHAPRDNFPVPAHTATATGTDVSADTPARIARSQPISMGQGLVDTFV